MSPRLSSHKARPLDPRLTALHHVPCHHLRFEGPMARMGTQLRRWGMLVLGGCDFNTTVPDSCVASVTVGPATSVVLMNQTVQLYGTARDENGHPVYGHAVTWTTTNPGVATVSERGLVRGVGPGGTTATATSEALNGWATIEVLEPTGADSVVTTVVNTTNDTVAV